MSEENSTVESFDAKSEIYALKLEIAMLKDAILDPRYRDMVERLERLEARFIHPSDKG